MPSWANASLSTYVGTETKDHAHLLLLQRIRFVGALVQRGHLNRWKEKKLRMRWSTFDETRACDLLSEATPIMSNGKRNVDGCEGEAIFKLLGTRFKKISPEREEVPDDAEEMVQVEEEEEVVEETVEEERVPKERSVSEDELTRRKRKTVAAESSNPMVVNIPKKKPRILEKPLVKKARPPKRALSSDSSDEVIFQSQKKEKPLAPNSNQAFNCGFTGPKSKSSFEPTATAHTWGGSTA